MKEGNLKFTKNSIYILKNLLKVILFFLCCLQIMETCKHLTIKQFNDFNYDNFISNKNNIKIDFIENKIDSFGINRLNKIVATDYHN
jgi:hypothetical protein